MNNKQYHITFDLNSPNISIKLRFMFHLILNFVLLIFLSFALVNKLSSFQFNNFLIVSVIGFVLAVILYIYYINKLIRRKKRLTDNIAIDYITNFPSEHNPAIIARLMQGENSDGTDLTSTLLDLIVRKYLVMDVEYKIEDLLDNSKNIVIRINDNSNIEELNEYEKYLINWFIKDLGENNEIKTSNLRNALKNDKDSGKKFLQWQSLVIADYEKENFIKNAVNKKNSFLVFMLLIIAFYVLSFVSTNTNFIVIYTLGLIAQLLTIKISFNDIGTSQVLTNNGENLTKKWNGFINYINTHSIIKEQHILHVSLYERYFVYAVALNIANKVNKDMGEKYGFELYKVS